MPPSPLHQLVDDTDMAVVNEELYICFRTLKLTTQDLNTLIMEVFSLLMRRQIARNNDFHYHFGCKEMKITHVCFADDLLVMCHGDVGSVNTIKCALEEFSAYSGRLQLIDAVLESIHVYWAAVFLLPKTIINEINKLLKRFLWNKGESAKGKAKVSWNNICSPKDQVKLRGKSIRAIDADINDSWGWRNLLSIRDKIRSHVIARVGNGRGVSMWYDNWSSIGPLSRFITYRHLYDARLQSNMCVRDMIVNGKWNWPNEWASLFPNITILEDLDIDEERQDKIMWKAIQRKLVTQDTMEKWGIYFVNRCQLCFKELEDHNHLFFKCEYSCEVWNKIKDMSGINGVNKDWLDNIQELATHPTGNNIWSVLRRIRFAACIYFLWQERNNRIFRDTHKDWETVAKLIEETVRLKLMSITVKNSQAVKAVEKKLFIKMKYKI
ncbi:reverse transcriptase domain, Reverse transcriptase zinc-binding domain protein [Artemisia annua]|uniref:Reverse transcriptase domain, Reverse transcriptase zinc-binding domain protein n=1 Tax=Artemisia annua TaxID=35608 RepID=A0A2U1P5P6_ARTAN|nr:reverse transcriptase domain, Reverse transcriptase zinc-binding domain protein [Artemisia annua]